MIPDPCPRCGHTTHPTYAFGRFQASPPGYRANHPGSPTRATRADAEADQCRWQADTDADPRDPMPGQETLL